MQNTAFNFDFSEQKVRDLVFSGVANVPEGSSYLQLITGDENGQPLQNEYGRVRYSKPVAFKAGAKMANFETTVKFVITNKGKNPAANGFVFCIVPVSHNFPVNPIDRSLGVFDNVGLGNSVVAFEFNTFPDNSSGGNNIRIGLDIGSNRPTKYTDLPKRYVGKEVTLSVKYDVAAKEVSARAILVPDVDFFELAVDNFDLSAYLPDRGLVCLAASTGNYASFHDVHGWEFNSTFVK